MTHVQKNHRSWWTLYKKHVEKVVLKNDPDHPAKVLYWRNAVFGSILTYLTPLSLIALIPSTIMAFRNGVAIIGFADLLTFFTIVFITVIPGIKVELRKFIFIFILYCLSLLLLYYLPLPGPGLLFALSVTIFSSLIYSSAAAYYSAWINTITCFCFALLLYSGAHAPVAAAYNLGAWIAVSSNLILLSFACAKCLDLLLSGLNASLKENTLAEKKLEKANRLYYFISQINQSIVHLQDESKLFHESCQIAFSIGKFKMAWIGKFDEAHKKIELLHQQGIPTASIPLFSAYYEKNGPQDYVLRSGTQYVCNDVENDLELQSWKPFATANHIRSCIILPIKKEGVIIGSFNIYSSEINFFDEVEIALLKEATGDISFALDIFEKEKRHKLAEQLIIENENRFRTLIEKSTDVKTLSDINGNYIYGSPSVTKFLGYTKEEFLNQSAFNLFHPDDLPNFKENRTRILELAGKSFPFQYRVLHKNGSWVWCEGTLTNMLHEPGIHAFVSNFRDITERKDAESTLSLTSQNLQNALDDLQKTMDASLDIICSIDEEGKFINISKASYTILGYHPHELIGKKYIDMVWEEDLENTNQVSLEIKAGNPVTFFENRYKHKNGNIVHMLWSSYWDNDSKLIYSTGKDVTERKKSETEKEKMSNDLMQRSQDLEQFSYMVSHNLRAPVANIIGFAELMKLEDSGPELMLESMKGMSMAANKLDEFIRDLNKILDIRTIVSENKEPVYFHLLVEDILLSIDHLIIKEHVTIRTDFKSIDNILSVRSYLYSIFYNLILNSIKFHKPGISPLIEITSTLTPGGIKLIFKDNGIGIDLTVHKETLFGLYKRFHQHVEGKGMGLFMTKTQVERLGGKISISSEVNKGTEFTIEFECNPL